MEKESLSAGRRRETLDFLPGHNVIRGRIVFQEACTEFGTLCFGELHRTGIVQVDAFPDFFYELEALLDAKLIEAEFLK